MSWLWPKRGIKRAAVYWGHRMARLPDTPHGIAAGVAAGAAMSFTPFLGLHIVLGSLVAFLIRGNYIGVIIGTFFGNPWTFPLIFALNYEIGAYILGTKVPEDLSQLPIIILEVISDFFYQIWGYVMGVAPDGVSHIQNADIYANSYETLLMPLLVGSVPTTLICWPIFYFSLKSFLERYHRRRSDKRMVKVATFNNEIHKEVSGDE